MMPNRKPQTANRKPQTANIIIVTILFAWLFFAFFTPFSEKTKAQFQRQAVPSNLLEYGETGKILKKLKTISPTEQYDAGKQQQNINDVINRAKEERRKWLHDEQYAKFRKRGVYCHIELDSVQEEVPIVVSRRKNDTWQEEKHIVTRPDYTETSFFLDIDDDDFLLSLFFANQATPLTIRSIVFLKKGYNPIAFYDLISYRHLLRETSSGCRIESDYFQILPSKKGRRAKIDLSFKSQKISKISKLQKKQGNNGIYLAANKYNPDLTTSSISDSKLEKKSQKTIPILAIDIPQESLYSKSIGILKNPAQHGRKWERIARIRYANNGEVLLNTFTGIRLQGGDPGRLKGLINFRLFFRKIYGESFVQSSLLFPGTKGIIKRVAVKQSEWPNWPFNSPIGYEITRQLGGIAPPTSPLLLYLNGKNLGLYYFVPHLGEKQIQTMFPGKDMNYFRWRGVPHSADYAFMTTDFWIKLKELEDNKNLNEQSIRKHFDLDTVIANVFAIIFAGTGDFVQGVILRENTPSGKMFWYQWDMDHSFLDIRADITEKKKPDTPRWQKSPDIYYLFNTQHSFPRIHLLRVLMKNEPEFKKKLLRTMLSMLNHRLTEEYFNEMIGNYETILKTIQYPKGDIYIKRIREHCDKRKDFLIQQIEELNILPKIKKCTITTQGLSFTVDNFPKKEKYTGNHTIEETLTIDLQDIPKGKKIAVNGKELSDSHFSFPVADSKECQIKIDLINATAKTPNN